MNTKKDKIANLLNDMKHRLTIISNSGDIVSVCEKCNTCPACLEVDSCMTHHLHREDTFDMHGFYETLLALEKLLLQSHP